jgi:hypothetical protein
MMKTNFKLLSSPSPCNSVHILNSHVEVLYVFNTTCFGINVHHHVSKLVDETCCSVVILLHLESYKKCKMLIKSFIGYSGYFCLHTFRGCVILVVCNDSLYEYFI